MSDISRDGGAGTAYRGAGSAPADDPARVFRVLTTSGEWLASEPELSQEILLELYRSMLMSRLLDEKLTARQRQGRLGFHGGATGQEAVAAGSALAAEPRDWIFPALRESTIMLSRGFSLETWLSQSYGVRGDVLRGRQMPSHMSGRAVNQVSWSSNMATQLPHAVGAALAARTRGDDMVALAFLGDGATSAPDFHHALRFAQRLRAPVLFVCQNNQWAISLPVAKQTNAGTLAAKGGAYRIPSERVDGNDVVAVYIAARNALARIRKNQIPEFLECITYRMGPHSSSDDPSRYRSLEEEQRWADRDPIRRLERHLTGHQQVSEATLESLRGGLMETIDAAMRQVEERGKPLLETMFTDVYARMPQHLQRQQRLCER